MRKELAESQAQLAVFTTVQVRASLSNTPFIVGELQCLGQLFSAFLRRIKAIAANIVDPLLGQTVAQPNTYEVSTFFEFATNT